MYCEKPENSDWLSVPCITVSYIWGGKSFPYYFRVGNGYAQLPYVTGLSGAFSVDLGKLGYPYLAKGAGDLLSNVIPGSSSGWNGQNHTITVSQIIEHIAKGNITIGEEYTIHRSPDESFIIIRNQYGKVHFPCWLEEYKEPEINPITKDIKTVLKRAFRGIHIRKTTTPL